MLFGDLPTTAYNVFAKNMFAKLRQTVQECSQLGSPLDQNDIDTLISPKYIAIS